MKLRIKGNSLRVRITPSELTRLLQTGRLAESICFGSARSLTYVLQHDTATQEIAVHYDADELCVMLPTRVAHHWADSSEVGIYATIGDRAEALKISVEKDFACLDKRDDENADTFPNPHQGAVC